MSQATREGTAIVMGASMAGLLAARALANHFEGVTIVERDTFPPPGENRKGVPQGRHTHVLLELGRRIMESYLPGLTEALLAKGASNIDDVSARVRWFQGDAFHQSGTSDLSGVGVSRPTLEAAIRARVLDLPNVHALEGRRIEALERTGDNARVTGVRTVDVEGGGAETLTADLVVDATGRGSHSPAWLEEMGYGRPPVDEVRVGLGYTTCFYRRRPGDLPGTEGVVFLASPPKRRLAVLLGQDGGRWVFTMGGYLGEHVSTDYAEFLAAARELLTPDVYDVVEHSEPLGEPVRYNFPANLRHRYESLPRFPEGYLVFGDALCSFNPIYGQGITVAAMEAQALDECLTAGRDSLARRFLTRAGKIIDLSWSTAVGNDLSFKEVEGPRTPMVRFLNWYIGKVHRAAHRDSHVSIAFLKVINMVAPPPSVMRPGIVWRVIRGNL